MQVMPYKLESYGISDIGLVRSNNEDVFAALNQKQFFVLADGMGGHKAGEIASSLAMESICGSINAIDHVPNVEEACMLLREAFAKANTKVFDESHGNPEYSGMGTTLSCFIITEDHLVYAHIGDSRLYRYRGKLEQLTEDHSLQSALPRGEISPLKQRNVITRAIGTHSSIHPDIGVIPLRPKDIFMLCSDGLSDYADEKKIARYLSAPLSLEEIGRHLVNAALEKGGNDNITLLLVKVG